MPKQGLVSEACFFAVAVRACELLLLHSDVHVRADSTDAVKIQ